VFDCYTASVTLENKNNVELTLWDTAGSFKLESQMSSTGVEELKFI